MTFAACVLQTAEMQVYIVFSSIPISITDYRELTAIQANLSDIQVNQPLTSSLFLPKCSLQSTVCKCQTAQFFYSPSPKSNPQVHSPFQIVEHRDNKHEFPFIHAKDLDRAGV